MRSATYFSTLVPLLGGLTMVVGAPLAWGGADLEITPSRIEAAPRVAAPGTPQQAFPVLVEQGKPVTFKATISNKGDRPARGSYAEIDVNRYPVKEGQKPVWVGVVAPLSVEPGRSVTRGFVAGRNQPSQFTPRECGIYIAVVNVDPEHAVTEDRGNNVAGIPLQVIPRRDQPSAVQFQFDLPDLVCFDLDQLLATTEKEPDTHHAEVQVGQEVRFLVTCRLEGAGPYPSYVEVEVNRRGAKPGEKPLWHGVLAFDSLKVGSAVTGLARARPEDELPAFWVPDKPGEYIVGAVADPGHKDLDLGFFLPRGNLIEPPGKDTDFTEQDDASKRYGNNAVFRVLRVTP